ncbi:hypothetical protein HYPSUDRAFT_49179 [Hypholoma sublateritium FD-334 SS-4]|uniref:Uncharacterized protein n=1 Tax=Hypholoma sublateritium (strain FD-334 SS-4) TaxID=945553 RepID=A0A0D2KIG0_HYPSF|nr:hypothetical protein HYPSUDRAFT_49179 [Hypholoma sublateritium FD-334 SS-4]
MLLRLPEKQDKVLKYVQTPAPVPRYMPAPAPPQTGYPAHTGGDPRISMYGTAEPASYMPQPARPQAEYPAQTSSAHKLMYGPGENAGTRNGATSTYYDAWAPAEGREGPSTARPPWPQPSPSSLRPQAEYPTHANSGARIPRYDPAETATARYEATSAYYDTRAPVPEWEELPLVRQPRTSPSPMSFNDVKGSGIAIGGGPVNIVNH